MKTDRYCVNIVKCIIQLKCTFLQLCPKMKFALVFCLIIAMTLQPWPEAKTIFNALDDTRFEGIPQQKITETSRNEPNMIEEERGTWKST